jgi:glycosyltransferase involved in cell wall biosynthesis
MPTLTISVVIPTRNRAESLHRLLGALSQQDRRPDEVIVVDASDIPADETALGASYPALRIASLRVAPSVCGQRNAGIRQAIGSHVLLCDDDVEPPPDYVRKLIAHVEREPTTGAVTGMVVDTSSASQPFLDLRAPSFRFLLLATVFQLTVWGDVEATESSWFTSAPLAVLKKWYRRRGNTWSLAGWPLVTQVRTPVVRAAIYGLGAALIRREWLLASPYDERLSVHGIGDNYGVALKFPGDRSIAVLTDLPVRHHKASENRLDAATTYYQRVLALDYFMRADSRFSAVNRIFLAWSLLGRAGMFAISGRRDLFRASIHAIALIGAGRNPLRSGSHVSPDVSPARIWR